MVATYRWPWVTLQAPSKIMLAIVVLREIFSSIV